MIALEGVSWRAVVVFRWVAPLRRDCFGPKTQLSKGVDKVLEFKQYFLAKSSVQHTRGVSVEGPMLTHERSYVEGPTSLQEVQLVIVATKDS